MKAFIVVDVQNDFCPGGSLQVAEGDRVVPVVNAHRREFELVVFTQDWHPRNHTSFASNNPGHQPFDVVKRDGADQVLWPDHCVQGTPGAQFHPELDVRPGDPVFHKGELPAVDSYSGFLDNDREHETGLRQFLTGRGVTEVTVAGLATDVCVKFTVLDALRYGFKTYVYRSGCRAVNLRPDDERDAWREMEQAGAVLLP
jgi:nicotinamidase/pyrazinamidase